jgi:DNA-binding NtrC family response regulator
VATQRVLYVEDNDYVRESVIELLGGDEREYIGCGSAETARTILATTPVQLLITDVNLPDGSGMDVVRHLLKTCNGCPVIVCSAHDLSRVQQELGPRVHFLRKPFELEELEGLVERLLCAPH